MHCGIFQGAIVPVPWKDFVIETALKMADSLISALNKGANSLTMVFVVKLGLYKCDPLCEIQAKVSKSNYEKTSIKV